MDKNGNMPDEPGYAATTQALAPASVVHADADEEDSQPHGQESFPTVFPQADSLVLAPRFVRRVRLPPDPSHVSGFRLR